MLRRAVFLFVLSMTWSCGGLPEQTSEQPSTTAAVSAGAEAARAAIERFAPENDANVSFLRIHELVRQDPTQLRDIALARLDAADPNTRFAAVYALSLTAVDGPSADALVGLLQSTRTNERLLAAAGLIDLGRAAGLPVLIAALNDQTLLDYRDPPKQAWELARSLLLAFTDEDLGLEAARSIEAVSAAKGDWEGWWNEAGASLELRPADRRFVRAP